jgi:thiol-disulfide isomerase/thioredoxin
MLKKTSFYLLALGLMLSMSSLSRAAEFTLTDTTGKTHKLSQYKGKWVLVNFWATWCPPCLDEIPDLIELHENKNNNLVVLGIALDYRNSKQVTDFADSLLVSYPIILGNPKIAGQIGPVNGLPTTYLYNPLGKLVAHQVGGITRESVQNFIRNAERTSKN